MIINLSLIIFLILCVIRETKGIANWITTLPIILASVYMLLINFYKNIQKKKRMSLTPLKHLSLSALQTAQIVLILLDQFLSLNLSIQYGFVCVDIYILVEIIHQSVYQIRFLRQGARTSMLLFFLHSIIKVGSLISSIPMLSDFIAMQIWKYSKKREYEYAHLIVIILCSLDFGLYCSLSKYMA